jgi:hypothetical protein
MIQSKTARQLMYGWHGGQTSPLYAAASSGLVSDWDALLHECECMKNDPYNPKDYVKLTEWIKYKQSKQKFSVVVAGQSYAVLPWVGRSY